VHSSKPPNAHSLMLHSRPDEVKVAAKSKGQDLMDKMNLTIRGLSETVARQRRDWQDKDSQLSGVDAQLGQMDVAEAAITNEWEQAQASHHDHRDLLAQRRERVAHLVQEIARLQDELQQENAGLDSIERAMLVYKDTARRTEHQLQVHRDEQGDLGAIRQALEEEKAIVGRDMINNESELKSLEAIQNLAIHE
jgi:chromosome segregation ATPase